MANDYDPDTGEQLGKDETDEPLSEETEDTADTEPTDDELVQRAKECYRLGIDASANWRRDALSDLEFLAGDQWDGEVKAARASQGRPALTINRLPQFVRQITNELRQLKPSIAVNPVDSESDVHTAEVYQGIIRNIEYTSNAPAAYATASQTAVVTGLGYWDICAEYEDERSFKQRLRIRRIRNPLSVVMDPGAKELAGDDARWCIISTDVSGSEWKAMCPDKEAPKGGGDWSGEGDAPADWVTKDGVRVHEYRYIAEVPDELIDVSQTSDLHKAVLDSANVDASRGGVLVSEIGPLHAATLKGLKLADGSPLPVRQTTRRRAKYCKIAGDEVIEKGEFAGRYLQLVRVVGGEIDINGRVVYEGVVRHAKDPQRIYNYAASAEAEAIALAPKAPWLIAEGQDEGYEVDWENANQKPLSRLKYRPKTVGGVVVPPPTRIMAEANVGAITGSRQFAANDLQATTGIHDAELGARSNEQSGRAILARTQQGQTANFHFSDNLGESICFSGRVLIDLIPKIYSGPDVHRILGEDDEQDMVPVNGHPGTGDGDGQSVVELDAGRYDVAVSMGPSYLSRRQEAAAQLMELIKVNPQLSQFISDLVVKNMDIPGGQAIAERLQKLLPPQIRPPDDKAPPAQVLQQQLTQSQQQLQGYGQTIDQLTQKVHALHDALESKANDNASKERIALLNVQAQLVATMAKLDSEEAKTVLGHQVSMIFKQLDLDGMDQPENAPEAAQGEDNATAG